jgi:AcrR family transcriptional regulator
MPPRKPKQHDALVDSAPEPIDGRRARRKRTEERLIAVVGELLAEQGIAALGVNAIAARADVEKVLIYRYFGGLEGLMAAYAARGDFWPTVDEVLGKKREVLAHDDPADVVAEALGRYARALRKRPVTLDLLGWECAHENPLTKALETVRETRTLELLAELARAKGPIAPGSAELIALFGAAINYLLVRSRSLRVFSGVAVKSERDWAALEQVMALALRGLPAAKD